MKIIIPKTKSKKVEDYYQIKELAIELQEFLEREDFQKGPFNKNSVALHHSQVSAEPFNFFVVKRSVVGAKSNEVVAIINPEIIEKDLESSFSTSEGCISFPFRPDKKIKRYDRIKVRHDIPDEMGGLETKEEWIDGFRAQIFQHECQHAQGSHIYH